jgi:hypothetical protein
LVGSVSLLPVGCFFVFFWGGIWVFFFGEGFPASSTAAAPALLVAPMISPARGEDLDPLHAAAGFPQFSPRFLGQHSAAMVSGRRSRVGVFGRLAADGRVFGRARPGLGCRRVLGRLAPVSPCVSESWFACLCDFWIFPLFAWMGHG